ncbi:MAG: zinc ribbon domain-containing protein [Planctomycetia bacterium]|nr:zinc ribbon domain-containing protein [Planctomycetia bacterium]
MPTYDYQCDACDHRFELFQSIKDNPIKKCPKCGKLKLRRLFGAGAAVVFKGSGFYQTDYRSASYQKRAAEDKKTTEPTTTTAEAKPAEKKAVESKTTDAKPKADKPKGRS